MTKIGSLTTATILGFAGLLLASQNAMATWYDVDVKEPEPVWPWATIPAGPGGLTLFGRGAGSGTLYAAQNSNGTWYFTPFYTPQDGPLSVAASASYLPGWTQLFDTYYIAHIDADMVNGFSAPKVRLTSWTFFNGPTTAVVDQAAVSFTSVATLVYGGKLYIFYASPQNGENTLKVAVYDGTKFTYQTIDGVAGPNGQVQANMYNPSAVKAPDGGIRVYYQDSYHFTIREAHSPDGVNWTDFEVIDGPGGVSGGTSDWVISPSAIPFGTTVNVFYTDWPNHTLRVAQRANGVWASHCVDAQCAETIDGDSLTAPVVHDNAMQVYYFSGGRLRAAYGRTPGAFALATLDGGNPPPPPPTIMWAVKDWMEQNVTAVEVNGNAPSVFYWDQDHPKLRNAYWQ